MRYEYYEINTTLFVSDVTVHQYIGYHVRLNITRQRLVSNVRTCKLYCMVW